MYLLGSPDTAIPPISYQQPSFSAHVSYGNLSTAADVHGISREAADEAACLIGVGIFAVFAAVAHKISK